MSQDEEIKLLKKALSITSISGGMDALYDEDSFTDEELDYLQLLIDEG